MHCLSNFKAQIECENIDFNADKVKQYEAVRKAMNSASLKISSLSLQILLRLSMGISDDATIAIDETKISEIEATKRRFRNYCVQTKY